MDGGTQSHRVSTSLAVWDVPLPAVAGERFAIKVGAKSAANAALTGCTVEVCNASGAVVASGKLGPMPWPGTEALYWTALEVPAAATEGVDEFKVRLLSGPAQPPHDDAASRFSVAVARKPEHRLSVTVVDKDDGDPLAGVEIRLGAFHARTDAAGRAEVRVCAGDYRLQLWKAAYDAPPAPVGIRGDTALVIAMTHIPEEHPDARWVM